MLTTCSGTPLYRFAISQYNKAIRLLRRRLACETHSAVVTLTLGVLFICIECLRGDLKEALAHIEAGAAILNMHLLQQTGIAQYPNIVSIEEALVDVFSRLSIQSSICGRHWAYPSAERASYLQERSCETTPFVTCQEARNALDVLMNDVYGLIREALPFKHGNCLSFPDELSAKRDVFLPRLCSWKLRLDSLLGINCTILTAQDVRGFTMLRILHTITTIWASTALAFDETAWDDYLEHFRTIISLTESLTGVAGYESDAALLKPSPLREREQLNLHDIFTFEMGTMPVVYLTALKCRCPRARRQAVHLLSILRPRREGLWDSRQLIKIANRVIKLEEVGTRTSATANKVECGQSLRESWPGEEYRVHGVRILAGHSNGERIQTIEMTTRVGGDWNVLTESIS